MNAVLRPTVTRYLKERTAIGEFRKTTARTARYILYSFAEGVGPSRPVARLSREDVEKWLANTGGRSAGTQYTRLCAVRAFTRWCVDHQLIKADPCAGIKGPRRPKGLPRVMDSNDIEKLLHHCDERLAVCVLLGVQEGLRRAEITRLSSSNVDTKNRLLRVLGKGNKERWVPLSEETASAIDDYMTAYPVGPHMPLIRSYLEPMRGVTPDRIGILISTAMKEAGVKRGAWDGKSAHALRHTCASDMLDRGADVRDVQEMLGHEHMATTTIYLRRQLAVSRLRDAASGRAYRISVPKTSAPA